MYYSNEARKYKEQRREYEEEFRSPSFAVDDADSRDAAKDNDPVLYVAYHSKDITYFAF